jgi:hypothetical protein
MAFPCSGWDPRSLCLHHSSRHPRRCGSGSETRGLSPAASARRHPLPPAYTAYLLLYVDNIVLTASSPDLLQHTTTALQQQFTMKDVGPLHHFLGVSVEQQSDGLFLHQHQYARGILERVDMSDCKPCSTPIDTQAKVSSDMGAPVRNPTAYHSLARALQYLTFTRPNIAYTVQHGSLYIHNPREPHLTAVKHILQ